MHLSNLEELAFDRVLVHEREKRTKLTDPPSAHLQAWRDYERQKYGVLGRNPPARNMGYNLWTDAVTSLQWAHRALTQPSFIKRAGFTRRTAPRRALCELAQSVGYRYLRGLEVIEHKLKGDELQRFHKERQHFRHAFETLADAAHAVNAKGEAPQAALEVVKLYAGELQALCPWLESVGQVGGAKELFNSAQLVG